MAETREVVYNAETGEVDVIITNEKMVSRTKLSLEGQKASIEDNIASLQAQLAATVEMLEAFPAE